MIWLPCLSTRFVFLFSLSSLFRSFFFSFLFPFLFFFRFSFFVFRFSFFFFFSSSRFSFFVSRFRFSFLFLSFFLRSEEHTSELQSLMRISYAVFCLKKKKQKNKHKHSTLQKYTQTQ